MEPKSSLTHSQVPATCPYPEPAWSSPYSHIPLPKRSILIFSSHLRLGLPTGLFPSGSPPPNPVHASSLTHTPYMHRSSHSSRLYNPQNIWWGIQNRLVYAYNNVSDEFADSVFTVHTLCPTLRDQDNNLLKPLAFIDQLIWRRIPE